MTTSTRLRVHFARFGFCLVLCASAAGCLHHDIANQLPTPVIVVLGANGAVIEPAAPVPAPPAPPVYLVAFPATITLDGSRTSDPDGTIVEMTWRRTDILPGDRFAGLQAVHTGGTGAGAGGAAAAPVPGYKTVDYATLASLSGVLAVGPQATITLPTTPAPGAIRSVNALPAPAPAYMYTLSVRDNAGQVGPTASIAIVQQP